MKSKYVAAGIALALIIITFFFSSVATRLNHVGTRARSFVANILHAEERKEEIARLQGEIALLEKQLLDQRHEQKQEALQRAKTDIVLKPGQRIIPSLVIGKGLFLGSHALIIDQGGRAGITGGEAVVLREDDPLKSGLIFVGRVANVFPNRSYVLLLTDASFEIMGKFTDESVKGKVRGGIGNHVTLEEVAQGLPLKEGQPIITDNDNPRIPSGIVIGTVERVLSSATDPAQKASVRTFFDPAQLDVIGVVQTIP